MGLARSLLPWWVGNGPHMAENMGVVHIEMSGKIGSAGGCVQALDSARANMGGDAVDMAEKSLSDFNILGENLGFR